MITTSYYSNTHQFPSLIVVRYIQMGPRLNHIIFFIGFFNANNKKKRNRINIICPKPLFLLFLSRNNELSLYRHFLFAIEISSLVVFSIKVMLRNYLQILSLYIQICNHTPQFIYLKPRFCISCLGILMYFFICI